MPKIPGARVASGILFWGTFDKVDEMDEQERKPVLNYDRDSAPLVRGGVDGRLVLLGLLGVAFVLGLVIWVGVRLGL
jgi:hypothetical protein